MHVILGATGHVGRRLVLDLLARGEAVGAVSRHAGRLAPLVRRGATPLVGDLEDPAFVARALSGARTLFSMIPPNPYAGDMDEWQGQVSRSIAAALSASDVTHVVNLSSLGAQLAEGTGPVAGLHAHEERLNALAGLNVLHLRPAWYMENFLADIDLIKANGVEGSPLRGDLRMPVVAAADVAEAAAGALCGPGFRDLSCRELLGPRDMTLREMTGILGRAVGLPGLRYVQFRYEEAEQAMMHAGFSPSAAAGMTALFRALNDGRITSGLVRTDANTTPTPFEAFAAEFAAAYRRGVRETEEAAAPVR